MNVLSNIEPRSVFKYFEEICEIPHGSGNTKAISDYLTYFAKTQGLKYRQDKQRNHLERCIPWISKCTNRHAAKSHRYGL